MLRFNRSFSIFVLTALLAACAGPAAAPPATPVAAHCHADIRSTDSPTLARHGNTSTAVASSRRQG